MQPILPEINTQIISLPKNDKMLVLAKFSFLTIFLSLQWKSVTLKCTGGADFQPRMIFNHDCRHIYSSL